jgi:hypothetical protein
MSTSGYDVMQEKDGDTPVVWTDFVGLRTHLEGVLDRSTADAVTATSATPVQSARQRRYCSSYASSLYYLPAHN